MNKIIVLLFSGIIVVCIISCKKTESSDTDTICVRYQALCDRIFNDALNIAEEAGYSDTLYLQSACSVITTDTNTNPHLLTIDFGPVDCLCSDGLYRRGKIITSYSGHYGNPLDTHVVSFDNYFVDSCQADGNITMTGEGMNNRGNYVFSVVVNGHVKSPAYSALINLTCNYTREWVQVAAVIAFSNDNFIITGNSSGSGPEGASWTANIIGSLLFADGCPLHYPVKGSMDITPVGKHLRTLDYGNGDCDNKATMTIDGNIYQITF